MSEVSDVFLEKAWESLTGADSEYANGRYRNAANRAYYATFQAAVAALDAAGIRPSGGRFDWSHAWVQAQFSGQLVNRRKVYSAALRDTLNGTRTLREQADYKIDRVSQRQAAKATASARIFVSTVATQRGATE